MDDPALDPATYDLVLRDLSRVNRWTLAARPTLGFLRRAAAGMPAFRLLDVGFGHGDMLRRIARWARRRNVAVDLIGVDLNPGSAAVARAATPTAWPIEYRTGDYRDVAGPLDFVVSSLVAHHMTDAELEPSSASWRRGPSAAGWSTTCTAIFSPIGLSFAGAADRRPPHRSRGRPVVDRPRLPPGRVAGDPRRCRPSRRRRPDRPALSVPAVRRTAALIVGGGPAGSAAAITLARAGAVPVLIERPGRARPGLRRLPRLGRAGGAAAARARSRLARRAADPPVSAGRRARSVEAALPDAAAGLSRRRLDAALLRLAERRGRGAARPRSARAGGISRASTMARR